jgi:hypothetical protein
MLWLNSFAVSAAGDGDGLAVVGADAAAAQGCIDASGSMGPCGAHLQIIPRKHNRLVLIAPGRAFGLSSPGEASLAKKPFDAKTAVALVFSFSPHS